MVAPGELYHAPRPNSNSIKPRFAAGIAAWEAAKLPVQTAQN
ncbi:MAG TPA: hypothetical protein VK797_04990 [Tepidisphaeraceae bacterium]|jgi:hypothetical protein|nr:hypothetical protein [Tepidisphaeraceae bacterium]